jgi:hypothetical protein
MGILIAHWLGYLLIPGLVLALIVWQVRRSRGQMFVQSGSAPTMDDYIRQAHRRRGW